MHHVKYLNLKLAANSNTIHIIMGARHIIEAEVHTKEYHSSPRYRYMSTVSPLTKVAINGSARALRGDDNRIT